ncbi:MAG: MFS transporter, partial [Dermatophilaceae bacterium]
MSAHHPCVPAVETAADRADGTADTSPELLDRRSPRGRLMLAALTLGSGVAILDGSVVNVALRSIGEDLDASLAQLQWVVNGYLLALASLVLVGGALGDRQGRRRVYLVGMTWFLVASLLCTLAQNPEQLIAARVLKGVGAALLTPGALALIQASYRPEDRAAAIGTWAGFSGV